LKNALAYHNAGVVAVNSKVIGLAPGGKLEVINRPQGQTERNLRNIFTDINVKICYLGYRVQQATA
jgi:hypothetical protein